MIVINEKGIVMVVEGENDRMLLQRLFEEGMNPVIVSRDEVSQEIMEGLKEMELKVAEYELPPPVKHSSQTWKKKNQRHPAFKKKVSRK